MHQIPTNLLTYLFSFYFNNLFIQTINFWNFYVYLLKYHILKYLEYFYNNNLSTIQIITLINNKYNIPNSPFQRIFSYGEVIVLIKNMK